MERLNREFVGSETLGVRQMEFDAKRHSDTANKLNEAAEKARRGGKRDEADRLEEKAREHREEQRKILSKIASMRERWELKKLD